MPTAGLPVSWPKVSALCPWQRLREPVAAADATLAEPLAAGSCDHVHGPALPHPACAAPARESGPCPTPLPQLLGGPSPSPLTCSPGLEAGSLWVPLPWEPLEDREGGGPRCSLPGACARTPASHRCPYVSPLQESPDLGNRRGGESPKAGARRKTMLSLGTESLPLPDRTLGLTLWVRAGEGASGRQNG